jgi:hypothetical protein
MRFQIVRSVRDKKIHVIFRDGSFETLPVDIRKLVFVLVHQSMGPMTSSTSHSGSPSSWRACALHCATVHSGRARRRS